MSQRAAGIAAITILLCLFVSGCGGTPTEPADPTPRSTSVTRATELTIVIDDGAGQKTTWTLTCDPAGGTHPDPSAACRALDANAARALPPVPRDVACTQIYGGPQQATITGTWQGQQVHSSFSRVNGCEISRWDLLRGLLPPGGV